MSNNLPTVAILIPAYNHENYVVETLNSILNDEYPNKEIHVIDDGSKDNTLKVIEEWNKKNSHKIEMYFETQKNCGISKTLNKMIKRCDKQFIVLIASDDNLINNSIRKRVEYLQNNPSKMVVFGDSKVIDENSNIIYESFYNDLAKIDKKQYATDRLIRKTFILNWCMPGGTLMVKRELFDTIGYYDESLLVEDWDIGLRIAAKDLAGFIDEKLSCYRWHTDSLSRNLNINIKRSIRVLFDYYKIILKNSIKYKQSEYKYFKRVFIKRTKELLPRIINH